MVNIDWNILRPVDIGGAFQQGLQTAQRNALVMEDRAYQNEERERTRGLRNALTGALNPETGAIDYGAVRRAYIGAGDVSGAMSVDTARLAQEARQREVARDNIVRGARIVRQINPTDQPSWERTLAAARASGVDITGAPTTFDPNYIEQLLGATAGASDPGEGYTLGEGDVRYDTNGNIVGRGGPRRPRYIPLTPGGRLVLDPSDAAAGVVGAPTAPPPPPAPGTVEDGFRFRGGNPADPGSWEPVTQGGPTPRASGNF